MTSMRPTWITIIWLRLGRQIRTLSRLASLLLVAAAIPAPASVLADTGPGPTGIPVAQPEVSGLSGLLGVVVPLALIAVAVAVVVGLASLVARIGGPAVAPTAGPGSADAQQPRSTIGTTLSVVVVAGAIVAIVAGTVIGRSIAYEASQGGLRAVGSAVTAFLAIVAVAGLALIGVIATMFRHGHLSRATGTFLAAAGLLAAGGLGGYTTAAATGGVYRAPVVLEAPGQTRAELRAGPIPFVARDGGQADCASGPDSQAVADITALDLGELGSGTLRAMIRLSALAADGATAELFIDGGDLPEGSRQPSWSGPVQLAELGADGASGKLVFARLDLADGAAKPAPGSSATTSAMPGWPASISGSLSWTCQPWSTPLPDSVAPPPSVAP